MTKDIVLLVDGAHWNQFANIKLAIPKLEGFYHNFHKGPYRNLILGLEHLFLNYPNKTWYCYMEYDCLVANDHFRAELEQPVWCLGNGFTFATFDLPYLSVLAGETITPHLSYLLGCCVFYHHDFLETLATKNLFKRMLRLTADFQNGFFPGYYEQGGYDFGEHLLPTLVHHFGGKIGNLASWDQMTQKWSGNYQKYPMRWRPELEDGYTSASILHPLKNFEHPLRKYFRKA